MIARIVVELLIISTDIRVLCIDVEIACVRGSFDSWPNARSSDSRDVSSESLLPEDTSSPVATEISNKTWPVGMLPYSLPLHELTLRVLCRSQHNKRIMCCLFE